ncbi:hypothetical protein [Paracoccus laeviglucosivorans]|uniref:Uncharacterized protein n=1 Tax=Paracoccus laeviglucosivorans TaxID=1197861 RepID=A0A521CNW9_9RHOB|nr:hypothetical protein [Paracoccus laeviglucosivorans]SMO61088.1 hypothetical protein SAMN06265221_10568 [Paracoccus laeviglucosivorans]
MTKGPRKPDAASDREARLKAALRANLAKRKAQGRARTAQESEDDEQHGPQTPEGRMAGNEE